MHNLSYWSPFFYLLATDLHVFKKTIKNKLINLVIWVSASALIATYVLPYFGMNEHYGSFLLVGLCASAGLFEVFPSVAKIVSDITGNQILLYHCTLPLPSCLVIFRLMLYNSISAALLSICVLPLGKLLLWNRFNFASFSLLKFLIIFLLASLFYGAYTIFIVTRVTDMTQIGNVWMRFVYPLWFLGGYQFSWQSLHSIAPSLAYINLLNPMIYIMEGTRAAILGPEGYLNFWLCAGMVTLFYVISVIAGIVLLKRRLDIL